MYAVHDPYTATQKKSGLFGRRRSNSVSSISSSDVEGHSRRSNGGPFHRNRAEDPSIVAARERVLAAERAGKDADIALQQARHSVRDAREHVRRLEAEAQAESKAAAIKASQAKSLKKQTKPLGSRSILNRCRDTVNNIQDLARQPQRMSI